MSSSDLTGLAFFFLAPVVREKACGVSGAARQTHHMRAALSETIAGRLLSAGNWRAVGSPSWLCSALEQGIYLLERFLKEVIVAHNFQFIA